MKTEDTNLLLLTPRWAPEGREVSNQVIVTDRLHCIGDFTVVTYLNQHWFKQRLIAYSAEGCYLVHCREVVNWKLANMLSVKFRSFCSGLNVLKRICSAFQITLSRRNGTTWGDYRAAWWDTLPVEGIVTSYVRLDIMSRYIPQSLFRIIQLELYSGTGKCLSE